MTELHPHEPKAPSATRLSARTGVILVVFTAAFTAVMALTYQATKAPIEASAQEEKLKLIGEVLPAAMYDNVLLDDRVEIAPSPQLGLSQTSVVYRARKRGAPVALVLEAAAPDGYSGRIDLLLAVRASGEVVAVRVTRHKETPGLGDYIDIHKDKRKTHPWISQFDGRSFALVPQAEWRVKKDGGRFDQVAGATISARAVTNAVGRALRYAVDNQQRLFGADVAAAGKPGS
jgi:Na+-translocating ferredoxin:NAD+ oxidoreductase subunit G